MAIGPDRRHCAKATAAASLRFVSDASSIASDERSGSLGVKALDFFRVDKRRLFQRRADGSELGVEFGAEAIYHRDDGERNAGCDESIFDRRSAGFIGEKFFQKFFHHYTFGFQMHPRARNSHAGQVLSIFRSLDDKAKINHMREGN
jgi:hypothetical protein